MSRLVVSAMFAVMLMVPAAVHPSPTLDGGEATDPRTAAFVAIVTPKQNPADHHEFDEAFEDAADPRGEEIPRAIA